MDKTLKLTLATLCAVGCTAAAMRFLSQYSFYAATLVPVFVPILAGMVAGMPVRQTKKGKLLKFSLPSAAKEEAA